VKLDENPTKRRKQVDAEIAKVGLKSQQLAIGNQKLACELYVMACPNGKPDDRIRLLLKDDIYNLITQVSRQRILTNASDEATLNKPITISTNATEHGARQESGRGYA
jgi:hypothetical protein